MPFSPFLFLIKEQYGEFSRQVYDLVRRVCELTNSKVKDLNQLGAKVSFYSVKSVFFIGFMGCFYWVYKNNTCKSELIQHLTDIKFIRSTNRKIILADLIKVNKRFKSPEIQLLDDSYKVDSFWKKNALFKCYNYQGLIDTYNIIIIIYEVFSI